MKGNFLKNIGISSPQKQFWGMKLKLGIHAKDASLYMNSVFNSGRNRTLVAMATYIFHTLIMG